MVTLKDWDQQEHCFQQGGKGGADGPSTVDTGPPGSLTSQRRWGRRKQRSMLLPATFMYRIHLITEFSLNNYQLKKKDKRDPSQITMNLLLQPDLA